MNEKILIADDDAEIRKMVSLSLELGGFAVDSVPSGEQALQWIQDKAAPSLLILDLVMPGLGGMETLRRLRQLERKMPVLVMSCLNTPDVIVEAMQNGASDYVMKPFENANLQNRISRLLAGRPQLRAAIAARPLPGQPQFVARNAQMLKIHETIRQISHTDVPVLVHGESGVGKEVVARAIHDASDRREKPFIKINCAALPSTLLESEMFGYERGAFTGAFNSKPGKFELANGGTIFLDEISEMSPPLQAKFLQVLQDSRFSRLGGKALVHVDVRVLAATNVNLKEALKSGSFREDLYYRLNVVNVYVPPLRERMDELEALIDFFIQKYGPQYGHLDIAPTSRLFAAMKQYDWPGNVRELENVIRRYLVLADGDMVAQELEDCTRDRFRKTIGLPSSNQDEASEVPFAERVNDLKRSAESEAIMKALGRTNWNRKEAAKLLNITYKSLLYRMKVLGIGAKVN
jgi:two-component system, NtrC family, response regulator AtoC